MSCSLRYASARHHLLSDERRAVRLDTRGVRSGAMCEATANKVHKEWYIENIKDGAR